MNSNQETDPDTQSSNKHPGEAERPSYGHSEPHRVFISYCRKDLALTEQIVNLLSDHHFHVLWDIPDIQPAVEWRQYLREELISKSDSVVCVISPNFILSSTCQDEVTYAQESEKRLIPVVIESSELPIHPALEKLNYIFLCHHPNTAYSGFYQGQKQLLAALIADQYWLRKHTLYLEHTRRWRSKQQHQTERSDTAEAYLLQDEALSEAWRWLREKPEQTTYDEEIKIYLQTSQEVQDRRRSQADAEAQQLREAVRKEKQIQEKHKRLILRGSSVVAILLVVAIIGNYNAAKKTLEAGEHNAAIFAREAQMLSDQGDHAKALQIAVAADPAAQNGFIENWLQPQGYLNARNALVHAYTQNRLLQHWQAHDDTITAITPHPFAPYVLTASRDKTAKLWHIGAPAELVQTLSGHQDTVAAIAFSPDGQYILTGSHDHSAMLWRYGQEQALQRYTGHTGSIYSVAFLPDNRQFLTGSYDQSIKLWQIGQEQAVQSFHGHLGSVTALSPHPDGQHFLSGSQDQTIKWWDIAQAQALASFQGHQDGIKSLVWHPDGVHFFSTSADHSAKLWQLNKNEAEYHWGGHTRQIQALAFDPVTTQVWTASEDQIRHWHWGKPEPIERFIDANPWADVLSFSHDGQSLFSASSQGELRLWQLSVQAPQERFSFTDHIKQNYILAQQASAEPLLISYQDNKIDLWSQQEQRFNPIYTSTAALQTVLVEPGAEYLAVVTVDGLVHRISIHTQQLDSSVLSISGAVRQLTFSRSGKHLLAAFSNQQMSLWRWPEGKLLQQFTEVPKALEQIAISADGQQILGSDSEGLILNWQTHQREPQRQWQQSEPVQHLAFLSDPSSFITIDKDNTPRLYSLEQADVVRQFESSKDKITSLAVDGQNRSFTTGHRSGQIQLWNSESSRPVLQFQAASPNIPQLLLDHTHQQILALEGSGSISRWIVPSIYYSPPSEQVQEACVKLVSIGMAEFSKQDYERFPFLGSETQLPCRILKSENRP